MMMNDASRHQICVLLLTIHLVLVLHDKEWIIIDVTKELDIGPSFMRVRQEISPHCTSLLNSRHS